MTTGFGSRILKKLIEKYLFIGYIDVNVIDEYTVVIYFYRGITRVDLGETHCNKFTKFLTENGVTNFKVSKVHATKSDWCYQCLIGNTSVEQLSGLIRLAGGSNAN